MKCSAYVSTVEAHLPIAGSKSFSDAAAMTGLQNPKTKEEKGNHPKSKSQHFEKFGHKVETNLFRGSQLHLSLPRLNGKVPWIAIEACPKVKSLRVDKIP